MKQNLLNKYKMKFENIELEGQKGLNIISKESLWQELDCIHEKNMKKFHSSYCPNAVLRDMETRCIVHSNENHYLVIKDTLAKMLKEYASGKVHWPGSFSAKEFNPLVHMFVKGEISEC